MIKIFEGYVFVQVNTFGIIQQIDEEKFGNYNKLLRVFYQSKICIEHIEM